jgi:3-phytase
MSTVISLATRSKIISKMRHIVLLMMVALLVAVACSPEKKKEEVPVEQSPESTKIKPLYVTDTVRHDTDDPAVWINYKEPSKSLIIGTDKDEDGALYVFDLQGKEIKEKTIRGLKRPNNVDVEYGLSLGGRPIDIAVVAERITGRLRVYSLPDMEPVDNGGFPVYEGESGPEYRDLMGVALYRRPTDGAIFVIAGRKNGPTDGTYLWQYLLEDDGAGQVKASLVRKFGNFSGKKEIEAIAVDDELGYVYYSDEQFGVRKYYADPDKGAEELALINTREYLDDNEGISIYSGKNGTGYLLVSDQAANKFWIYTREGTAENPHDHQVVKVVDVSTISSDGSETINYPLGEDFPNGLFVAMSEGRTFQIYRWEDIAGSDLVITPPAVREP